MNQPADPNPVELTPMTTDEIASAQRQPVVVVQYRGRGLSGLLIPPALILAVAAAILAYRIRQPDWRGLKGHEKQVASRPVAAGPKKPEPEASPPVAEAPKPSMVLKIESPPQPGAEQPPLSSPFDPPASEPPPAVAGATKDAPQPDPTAEATTEVPPPSEPVTKAEPPKVVKADQVHAEIRREAAAKRAERESLQALKEDAAQRAAVDNRRREEERLGQFQDLDTNDRVAFHKELRAVLGQPKGIAEQAVQKLCERHGATLLATSPFPGTLGMPEPGMSSSAGRKENVAVARDLGQSEPAILIRLAQAELRNKASRTGPSTPGEALIRAARVLLEVPLDRRPATARRGSPSMVSPLVNPSPIPGSTPYGRSRRR